MVVQGPVLLLVGPLGLFFSRVSRHLEKHGVKVYKLSLPLIEPGFRREQLIRYNKRDGCFKGFLENQIHEKGIKHLMMYGDYIHLHAEALTFASEHTDLSTTIFELGYIRPGYITVEEKGVNRRSCLAKNVKGLPSGSGERVAEVVKRRKLLRLAKALIYIVHSFTPYQLMDYRHKLDPQPIDLWHQYWGYLSYMYFKVKERAARKSLDSPQDFVLVALQVAFDSQLKEEEKYSSNEVTIIEVCRSLKEDCADKTMRVYFKHHPRDRGFNNYRRFIKRIAECYGVNERVQYIHDVPMDQVLSAKRLKGVITINSTVGIESISKGIPTLTLGKAFYASHELTHQGSLTSFWSEATPPSEKHARLFIDDIIERTQIRGSFEGDINMEELFLIEQD